MKQYAEIITWYDTVETKPRNKERVLITVGSADDYGVDIATWLEEENRFFYGVEEGETGIPSGLVWSWARLPKAIQFTDETKT